MTTPEHVTTAKEKVNYCVRPPKTNKVRLRIHHRGQLVEEPVKWYVNGQVTEMKWGWDVDYISYMQIQGMIKSEGYANIKCLWYWNPAYSFARGLRPLNNDTDVLQFSKDVEGYEVVDLYVEHSIEIPDIVDESELDANIEVDDDVQCTGFNCANNMNEDVGAGVDNEDENIDEADGVGEGGEAGVGNEDDQNKADGVGEGVESGVANEAEAGNEEDDIDEDYVASESSYEDSEFQFSGESDVSEMNWTKVLPQETLGSDDEDEEGLKFPTYKSGEGMKFQLGMMFTNKEVIRDAVKDYGMENQKNVYIKKNDSKRVVVLCTDGCKFYMRFSKRIGNQFWQVVSLIEEHTCHRTADNRSTNTKWLAKRFATTLRHSPQMKPAGLIAEALERWGVKLSHDQAYRAKRKAMELVQGAGIEQFSHLRSYGQEILKSNPNSTVVIQCANSSGLHVFERIYICLESCKVAFAKTCRPLIGLDACFLKGDYGGQLMAAVGRDGNNQIFPIAYAVVEAETGDSWQWFLDLLLHDLEAVQAISDNVECRLCVKHLYGNWKKRHPGLELKEVLWAAARATTIPAWEKAMLKMKTMKEEAWKDMVDIPAGHWSRSHFNTYTKCDLQVNNMCEAFNRAILEHREKPIITLLEGIKQYITKRITNEKELLQGYTGSICPKIQLVIEKHKKQAQGWSPTWHGDDDLSIFGVTNGNDTYCVDLKKETCSCRKWQLTGIPCSHVIACIWNIKKKPEDYVASCYRKSTFMETYSHIVYPTNGPQLWPVDDQNKVEPPVMRREIGRPEKQRNKTNDEPRNPHILPRRFSTVTCAKCGAMGHNKRSCKGKRAADRAIPKGGNKPKKAAKTKKVKTKEKQVEIGQGSQAPQPTQE
ncbi:uncharacterized protein LOC131659698 [Vicia villosa]|uniref:uncharacterized protein LOC131659698 n=1 Tax=Vicia villosa TaxID=3911 RepID=UPI00273B40A1|nr:uncharacterized protein LOC131659698 [Vicia villosa]